ncbi:hypothetical protein LCGC14_1134450, partial [marine sediment metagenome]
GDIAGTVYNSGYRFQTVNVPQGDTIDVSTIDLRADGTSSPGSGWLTKVFADDVDDALTFDATNDIDGRPRTTAGVDWDPGSWAINTWHTSPECKTVIQEIVDRASWAANNDMAIIHDDDGTPTASNYLRVETYDSNTTLAPKLHIEFTAAGVTVTPTTLALVLTEFAPTVTATGSQLVTPPALALTLATFAPTATATENQLVTPPVLALILSEFAPTVTATGDVVVTPSTLALTLAAFAPTVSTPTTVTPPVFALTLTPFAPTVTTPRLVTPSTLALVLSEFAPTVTATGDQLVTPTTLALLLTEFVPTVTVSGIYTSYGGPFLYTAANWNAAVEFFLEVYLKAIEGTVRARLYNDTDATVVADSGLSTAATSYTRLRSSALSLTDGKIYLVQFGTESVANGEFKAGKLIAV